MNELSHTKLRIAALFALALTPIAAGAQEPHLKSAQLEDEVLRLQLSQNPHTVRHFPLASPPRVVVDLFGIDRSIAEMPASPSSSSSYEVRTGEHPGFLRVVVDLRSVIPSYQVRQSEELVEVALGATALPPSTTGVLIGQAPVPASSATPQPATTAVARTERGETTSLLKSPTSANDLANIEDLSTDELLALIEESLAALPAEELIEQVEAELAALPGSSANANEPAQPEERAPAREGDPEDRPPFRFIDEEPDDPPGS